MAADRLYTLYFQIKLIQKGLKLSDHNDYEIFPEKEYPALSSEEFRKTLEHTQTKH